MEHNISEYVETNFATTSDHGMTSLSVVFAIPGGWYPIMTFLAHSLEGCEFDTVPLVSMARPSFFLLLLVLNVVLDLEMASGHRY